MLFNFKNKSKKLEVPELELESITVPEVVVTKQDHFNAAVEKVWQESIAADVREILIEEALGEKVYSQYTAYEKAVKEGSLPKSDNQMQTIDDKIDQLNEIYPDLKFSFSSHRVSLVPFNFFDLLVKHIAQEIIEEE